MVVNSADTLAIKRKKKEKRKKILCSIGKGLWIGTELIVCIAGYVLVGIAGAIHGLITGIMKM